jgi:hypothetical protein
MTIWKPTRREFIKSAAPLITGAAAVAAMPKLATALAKQGVANIAGVMPAQPSLAKTWGYNTPIFWDDFVSPNTIDLNNTLAPGYNWYMSYSQGAFASGDGTNTLPSSAVSISSSILTLNIPTQKGPNQYALTTMGCKGASPSVTLVGNQLAPQGAYFEARIQYNAAMKANPGWPAWWMFDNNLTLALANSVAFPSNGYVELDFMEGFYSGSGNPNLVMTDWSWYSFSSQCENSNTSPNVGGSAANDGNFHTYGCLWVPQAKNSGTGIIQRYFDGTHQANCDISYSSTTSPPQAGCIHTGWLSALDTNTAGFGIQLASGQGWPISVDYVAVWA